ncbi:MAG: phenylalanine--tRNA ligase subunit beta [Parcubacteria group bacterium]|nr:phenylalanine--tRNA ligase subunit beta [Parcubacteria group bacterium]
MKFSYDWLKELIVKIPPAQTLVAGLNARSFEAAKAGRGLIEASLPPNRFSELSSYWGTAKEIAAVFGLKTKIPAVKKTENGAPTSSKVKIVIKDKSACSYYLAKYAEGVAVGPSPLEWREKLKRSGLRPINNIVDAMNMAMLETGQPLHAFDYDRLVGGGKEPAEIFVRKARKGEKITTLDGKRFDLDDGVLVIAGPPSLAKAGKGEPLAIAGIKGGKSAEVGTQTKRILIEAANFDAAGIYKTSRRLSLATDASSRFAHGVDPAAAETAIERAADLLREIGAAKKIGATLAAGSFKKSVRIIGVGLEKLNEFLGSSFKHTEVADILKRLEFPFREKRGGILEVEIPLRRGDISDFEDIAEEIARLRGYENISPKWPTVAAVAKGDDIFKVKDKLRLILNGLGFSEVCNYSFVSSENVAGGAFWGGKPVEILNPVSSQFRYFRPTLVCGLLKNIPANLRFFDEVKIFEFGKVAWKERGNIEKEMLGLALGQKGGKISDRFFEAKGTMEAIVSKMGLTDYFWTDLGRGVNLFGREAARLESDHRVLGYAAAAKNGDGVVAEIDLGKLAALAAAEREFSPFRKYPSVARDVSFLIGREIRIEEIMGVIHGAGARNVDDVDLLDCYESETLEDDAKSLTFRIVFQAEDRTLTDEEVGKETEKIIAALRAKFNAEMR